MSAFRNPKGKKYKSPLQTITEERSGDTFVRSGLENRYKKSMSEVYERPLHVLYQSGFKLTKFAPFWVRNTQSNLNNDTVNYTVLGGSLKDVVIFKGELGAYVYTFYIPPPRYADETRADMYMRRINRYHENVEKLSDIFSKLNAKVQDRLNFAKYNPYNPKLSDIYTQEFVDKLGRTRLVTMTRIRMCSQLDLNSYIKNEFTTKKWEDKSAKLRQSLQLFLNLVYSTMKVLTILHEKNVYVLDIKPENIFVCDPITTDKVEYVFAFGDIDQAEICQFKDKSGLNLCKSDLASLFYLPSNAIMNPEPKTGEDPERFRNLYGVQGYAIRDAYALSKTLLMAFNRLFFPQQIMLLFENYGFGTEQYDSYQGMTNADYEEKLKAREAAFIDITNQAIDIAYKKEEAASLRQKKQQIVEVVHLLWDLRTITGMTGRPNKVLKRLKRWKEMPTADALTKKMISIKRAAVKAKAVTFTRNTNNYVPSRRPYEQEEEEFKLKIKF